MLLEKKTYAQVDSLNLQDLNNIAAKIKITGKCSNSTILILKRQVQIVAFCSLHSFAKCVEQSLFIKVLMISNRIFKPYK